jgi:hypothetical protein
MNAERPWIEGDFAACVFATHPLAVKGAAVAETIPPLGGPRIDLRSAASGAAIELDNIRLRRGFKTEAIQRLAQMLTAGLPSQPQTTSPMSLVTPTVVVMDRVVRSSKPDARIEDVIQGLDNFLAALKRVASEPSAIRDAEPDTIEELQTTCLDISRFAASLMRPTVFARRNPPRR